MVRSAVQIEVANVKVEVTYPHFVFIVKNDGKIVLLYVVGYVANDSVAGTRANTTFMREDIERHKFVAGPRVFRRHYHYVCVVGVLPLSSVGEVDDFCAVCRCSSINFWGCAFHRLALLPMAWIE
jgi:hypothetical protein